MSEQPNIKDEATKPEGKKQHDPKEQLKKIKDKSKKFKVNYFLLVLVTIAHKIFFNSFLSRIK